MLKLYLDEVPEGLQVENDVEKMFRTFKLKCTEKEKEAVRVIEQGELIDAYTFRDRFGVRLYTNQLSTGCKAALCVLNAGDTVVNLMECGLNARDFIMTLDTGAVVDVIDDVTICNIDGDNANVLLNGYVFTSLDRLNKYIFDEIPYEPDMAIEGIKKYNGGV